MVDPTKNSVGEEGSMMIKATRMCIDCLTTDPAFPLIPGCQSCKAMLTQDEFDFWNGAISEEEDTTPKQLMRRVVSPWVALFRLITLS